MVRPENAQKNDATNEPTQNTPTASENRPVSEVPEPSTKANAVLSTEAEKSTSAKKAKPKKKKKPGNGAVDPTKGATVEPAAKKQDLPDKSLIETKEEMADRLKHGTEYNRENIVGLMVAGTVENPVIDNKTITFPDDEIQKLLAEVSEIKHLLFCRLLLGHATLLPAALRANNVEEFLGDEEVTANALRDLCLKLENPGLQDIRDACADLFRPEEEPEDDEEENVQKTEEKDEGDDDLVMKPKKRKGELPEKWISKREKAKQASKESGAMPTLDKMLQNSDGTAVDFGEIKDDKAGRKNIRVKILGRTIWNYPSDKAINRRGWLHFCIIAKDSSLYDAVALCRHWDEFFELNILAIWHYFPGKNWAEWVGNRFRQQMLQLVSFSFFRMALVSLNIKSKLC